MRKASEATVEQVIGGFPKGRRQVIEARLLRVGGALVADVRAFVASDDGGLVPTRAGLRLNADLLPALAKLVDDTRAAADVVREGAESGANERRKGGAEKGA